MSDHSSLINRICFEQVKPKTRTPKIEPTEAIELLNKEKVIVIEWTLPGVDFLQNDTSINDLEKAMNVLKDVKGLPKITADTIAKIKAARTPFYKKPLPTAAIIMGVLALILILSLLTVIYCQAWRAKRREKRAADPVHRFTEVLRNHDNIEEILGLLESKAAGNR